MSKKTDGIKTLTNEKLYQLLPALSNLISKDTPMKVSINLRKTLRSVRTILKDLDESRQAKVTVHTTQDKEGNDVVDEVAFAVDMQILLKETSDIKIISTNVAEFPEDFTITTADLDVLLETNILTE